MGIQLYSLLKNRPAIMGIVNVTPDSFSDGGRYYNPERAIEHGVKLLSQGAHILDIGGESTRPGAEIIDLEEEISRIVPVVKGLKTHQAAYISIDTRNAQCAHEAIKAGANIINDVSGLTHDPDMVHLVAESKLPICIMHMKGTPQTMQQAPQYDDVIDEVYAFFEERIEFCLQNNIDRKQIILDPGIGFGKTLEHNLTLVKNLSHFKTLGRPLLLGASRKSFIEKICPGTLPKNRLPGSLAAAISGIEEGAEILRVHDVEETIQALQVHQALCESK